MGYTCVPRVELRDLISGITAVEALGVWRTRGPRPLVACLILLGRLSRETHQWLSFSTSVLIKNRGKSERNSRLSLEINLLRGDPTETWNSHNWKIHKWVSINIRSRKNENWSPVGLFWITAKCEKTKKKGFHFKKVMYCNYWTDLVPILTQTLEHQCKVKSGSVFLLSDHFTWYYAKKNKKVLKFWVRVQPDRSEHPPFF